MKYLLCVTLAVGGLCLSKGAHAMTIQLSKNKKPGKDDLSGSSANATFLAFLACNKGKEKWKSEDLTRCAQDHFAPTMNIYQVRGYSQLLNFPNKYSDLFYCPPEIAQIVQSVEEKGYDLFLCVDSNLMAPKMRTGFVLFKKIKDKMKILRIKL